jgi:hypothetical protein
MLKTLMLVIVPFLFIVGCSDRYRYECQDHNNWDKPRCQKPICTVHKDCPEDIFGPQFEQMKGER